MIFPGDHMGFGTDPEAFAEVLDQAAQQSMTGKAVIMTT